MSETRMTPGEKRAYARGYSAGAKWPDHKPPYPPTEAVEDLMRACRRIRDGIDGELSKFGDDPEWEQRFGPLIDCCDSAMEAVTQWLRSEEPTQ